MNRCLAIFLLTLPSLCGLLSVVTALTATSPALEPDDFRYFSQLGEFLSDPLFYWRNVFVITNSWEDQWWVASGHVRYLRPIPILTYLVDIIFFGHSAYALLYTNVLLFLGLCLSVTLLLKAITSNGIAAPLGACWLEVIKKKGDLRLKLERRQEYFQAVIKRYQRSEKRQKGITVAEFCAATGLNRSYAIWLEVIS